MAPGVKRLSTSVGHPQFRPYRTMFICHLHNKEKDWKLLIYPHVYNKTFFIEGAL